MSTPRALPFHHFDPILFLCGMALAAYGGVMIYSASLSSHPSMLQDGFEHPVVRQGTFGIAGIIAALAVSRIDYRLWGQIAPALYLTAIGLLLIVLVIGDETLGSRRWIDIGGVPVQASEIAKLLFIIALARFLADRGPAIRHPRNFIISLALSFPPIALIMLEPDFGTSMVIVAICLGMVICAGARGVHLFTTAAVVVLGIPFLLMAMTDYQRERLVLFIKPEYDPFGAAFNIRQAEISIGSGGLLGKGLTEGTQTQLEFLRTRTTDYVFSVLGEELGFVGAVILFALFTVLLFRGIRVASLTTDPFGRLVAIGVVVTILAQVFINVGVNVGLLPVTGLPLPFISQGGSSLVTLFVALGILQSILMRHRRIEFE